MTLLQLPLDLREEIYKACLLSNVDIIVSTRAFTIKDREPSPSIRSATETPRQPWYPLIPYLALSMTCKTISSELHSMLARSSRVTHGSRDDLRTWEFRFNAFDRGLFVSGRPQSLVWTKLSCPPANLKTLVVTFDLKQPLYHVGRGAPSAVMVASLDIIRHLVFHGPTLRPGDVLPSPIKLEAIILKGRVSEPRGYRVPFSRQAERLARCLAAALFDGVYDRVQVHQDVITISGKDVLDEIFAQAE